MNLEIPLGRKEETRDTDVEDAYILCSCGKQNLHNACYCDNCSNTLAMATSNSEGLFLHLGDKIFFEYSDIVRPGYIVSIDNNQQIVTVRLSEKPWNTNQYGQYLR